ncbi:MAG: phosphate ABC transporter ATP-binding protein [Planctomycetota bacterium]
MTPEVRGDTTSVRLVAGSPQFEIRGLQVSYGSRRVLADVACDLHRGRITAIVGPSGCGKTSFLGALNRMGDLVVGCHVQGTVRLEGEDIRARGFDTTRLRRRVGMIFQKPNPFPMSIRANLQLAPREHGLRSRSDLEALTERVLREVGLFDEVKDRLQRSALELSGGQQQRLCLARALALDPEVLLLDEPCSSLDPVAAEVVEGLIESLRSRLTVIVVTHNLAQARRIADEVAVFWVRGGVGRLIEQGTSERIFGDPSEPETIAYVAGRTG